MVQGIHHFSRIQKHPFAKPYQHLTLSNAILIPSARTTEKNKPQQQKPIGLVV